MENETYIGQITVSKRHYLVVFFFSMMWGIFGVDRFYLGKVWTGILKLLTLGGFGIWLIVDLASILSGTVRDKQGYELQEMSRFKPLVKKIMVISSVITTVIVIAYLAAIAFIVYFYISIVLGGGDINSLTNGVTTNIPGLDVIKQLQSLGL